MTSVYTVEPIDSGVSCGSLIGDLELFDTPAGLRAWEAIERGELHISLGYEVTRLALYDTEEERFLDPDETREACEMRERRGYRSWQSSDRPLIELISESVLQEVSLCTVPSDDETSVIGPLALSRAFDKYQRERRMLELHGDDGGDYETDPQVIFEKVLYDRRILHFHPPEMLNIVT